MVSDEKLLSHRKAVGDYFEATAHYWEDLYDRQDRFYRQRIERVLQFTDKLGLPPESRLLEIGCGPGATYELPTCARRASDAFTSIFYAETSKGRRYHVET